jgi:hypothetical protein
VRAGGDDDHHDNRAADDDAGIDGHDDVVPHDDDRRELPERLPGVWDVAVPVRDDVQYRRSERTLSVPRARAGMWRRLAALLLARHLPGWDAVHVGL